MLHARQKSSIIIIYEKKKLKKVKKFINEYFTNVKQSLMLPWTLLFKLNWNEFMYIPEIQIQVDTVGYGTSQVQVKTW
jgi:hypothetical protein